MNTAHNKSKSAKTPAQELSTTKFQRIHIIVNPASGQKGLNLPELNRVLNELDIDWEMFVTRKSGDAFAWAKQAIEESVDAVAVFGGDGTVLEVSTGLKGSTIPLVILPGGTANVLAIELGIPLEQSEAALLLGGAPNAIRPVDMGSLQGPQDDTTFFFHLGMGLEGALHKHANREAKDKAGMFAYVIAALKARSKHTLTHYRLTIDGEEIEVDGINCMITNFGSIGVAGLKLSHAIDVSDGLLDVIIFENANVTSLLAAAASAVTSGEVAKPLLQWQAREVSVVADPPQAVAVDGELIEAETVTVQVVPHAVNIVVPADSISDD